MNALKLIQKQGFISYEFVLLNDNLSVKQYSITGIKEFVTKVEDIGYRTILEKEASLARKLVAIFLGLCSLLIVIANVADHSNHMNIWFWFVLSTSNMWLAAAMFFTPVTNELRLVGGSEELVFLADKPTEKEVRDFVNKIIKRSKNALLRKYTADPDLPESLMITQLNWLLDRGVIDNEVFNEMKAKYYSHKLPLQN